MLSSPEVPNGSGVQPAPSFNWRLGLSSPPPNLGGGGEGPGPDTDHSRLTHTPSRYGG